MCLDRKYVSGSQKERRPQNTLVSKNVSGSQKECPIFQILRATKKPEKGDLEGSLELGVQEP